MAQTVPQFKPQVDKTGVTYRPDPDDADDVHIVAEFQTETDMGYVLECLVLVVEDSTYATVNGYKLAGVFKNDGGTLAVVGSTANTIDDETDTGWACAFAVSGTKVQVQLTLDASHTSSAPVIVRSKLTECLALGSKATHMYGSSDNNP